MITRTLSFFAGLTFAVAGLFTALAVAPQGLATLATVSLAMALAGCAVMALAAFDLG